MLYNNYHLDFTNSYDFSTTKKNKNLKICEIIKFNSLKEGNKFYSNHDDYLQFCTITQNKGFKVQPHIHIDSSRKISKTQEVWILIEGKLNINFYFCIKTGSRKTQNANTNKKRCIFI